MGPTPPFRVNFEIAKFFMYCLFPVGFLYIFNRPELRESFFFRDHQRALEEIGLKPDPAKLEKIPKTRAELEEYMKKHRKD